jgi:hypothetical protein
VKRAVAIVGALGALTACGTTGLTGDQSKSAYLLVSQGDAGGLWGVLTGKVRYCKVTANNLGSTEFVAEIRYDGNGCEVVGSAENQ